MRVVFIFSVIFGLLNKRELLINDFLFPPYILVHILSHSIFTPLQQFNLIFSWLYENSIRREQLSIFEVKIAQFYNFILTFLICVKLLQTFTVCVIIYEVILEETHNSFIGSVFDKLSHYFLVVEV